MTKDHWIAIGAAIAGGVMLVLAGCYHCAKPNQPSGAGGGGNGPSGASGGGNGPSGASGGGNGPSGAGGGGMERTDRGADETFTTVKAIPAALDGCPDGKCPPSRRAPESPPPPEAVGRLTVIPLHQEPAILLLGAGTVKQARTLQEFSLEAEVVFANGQTRRETVFIPTGSTITPPIGNETSLQGREGGKR